MNAIRNHGWPFTLKIRRRQIIRQNAILTAQNETKKGGKVTKRFKNIIMLDLEPKSVSFFKQTTNKNNKPLDKVTAILIHIA